MTERSRSERYEDFENNLLVCLRELLHLMPELDKRYGAKVVLQAMAEHVGRGLHTLRKRNICNDAQAQTLIKHITDTAFPPKEDPKPSLH